VREQQVWGLDELRQAKLGRTVVWARQPHRRLLEETITGDVLEAGAELPEGIDTLVVVGGGTLIDQAKRLRRDRHPKCRLIAIPTLWGSGAECSPIAVRTVPEGKDIQMGDDLLPDVRVEWPELGATVPPQLAKWACGDAWSHAYEAFVSPLASDEIRSAMAALMNRMAQLPLAYDPSWFGLGVEACLGQARSSVGLVHGFAHVLEARLGPAWSHARLCSVFLLPVIRFNLAHSPKLTGYAATFGADAQAMIAVAEQLFEPDGYAEAMRAAPDCWTQIARDRCSRTNHVLVRANAIEFFQRFRETT
jgi:alcohol dehydrogenase class IV